MNTPAMQITRALGGEWRGATGMARCPAHDDRVPSLAIAEQDGKVLVHCHAGCLQKTVVSALYRLRVWPTQDAARHRRNSNIQAPSRYEPNIDRSHWGLALKIWQASVQAEGSPAKQYLLHRGITTPAPASLRFSPRLRHTRTGEYLPAILAAIHDSADIISGIQRVFIRPDGLGKADVTPAKMGLGPQGDGAVRLAPVDETTGLCEGWETGLSAMQRYELPVWCSLGASRMHQVAFPSLVRKIVIFADKDEAGRQAAERTADVHQRQGRCVEIRFPALGVDFNDELIWQGQQ